MTAPRIPSPSDPQARRSVRVRSTSLAVSSAEDTSVTSSPIASCTTPDSSG